jgi:hypothetical protein
MKSKRHMPGTPVPPPVFASWADYVTRATEREIRKKCQTTTARANRPRLMSAPPGTWVNSWEVWEIMEAARGRCVHCGSLAVERRPSTPKGFQLPWTHIGRRVGSLEHVTWRALGGDNDALKAALEAAAEAAEEGEEEDDGPDYAEGDDEPGEECARWWRPH